MSQTAKSIVTSTVVGYRSRPAESCTRVLSGWVSAQQSTAKSRGWITASAVWSARNAREKIKPRFAAPRRLHSRYLPECSERAAAEPHGVTSIVPASRAPPPIHTSGDDGKRLAYTPGAIGVAALVSSAAGWPPATICSVGRWRT